MIQWIGIGLTVIGMLVNGYRQYSSPAPANAVPAVEYYQQQATCYQAAFDPVNGKVYALYPDGKWYEVVPVPSR